MKNEVEVSILKCKMIEVDTLTHLDALHVSGVIDKLSLAYFTISATTSKY